MAHDFAMGGLKGRRLMCHGATVEFALEHGKCQYREEAPLLVPDVHKEF